MINEGEKKRARYWGPFTVKKVVKLTKPVMCECSEAGKPDNSGIQFVQPDNLGGLMILSHPREDIERMNAAIGLPKEMGAGSDTVPIIPGSVTKSPDSSRSAWLIHIERSIGVVVDGELVLRHEAIMHNTPNFSPDSKHVTYFAEDYEVWRLVIDGKPGNDAYDAPFFDFPPRFLNSNSVNFLAWKDGRIYYVETHIS